MCAHLQVAELHGVLEKEQMLNGVLQCALNGPLVSRSSLSSMLPLQVRPASANFCRRC